MSLLPGGLLRNASGGGLMFFCPGCREPHAVWTGEGPGPRWGWNGSTERPTFTPSLRVQWENGMEQRAYCCHSFITDGQIQFLADSTHALAGQTVPIPPWPQDADAE